MTNPPDTARHKVVLATTCREDFLKVVVLILHAELARWVYSK